MEILALLAILVNIKTEMHKLVLVLTVLYMIVMSKQVARVAHLADTVRRIKRIYVLNVPMDTMPILQEQQVAKFALQIGTAELVIVSVQPVQRGKIQQKAVVVAKFVQLDNLVLALD